MKKHPIMHLKIFLTAALLAGLLQAAPAIDWYVATNGTGTGTNNWANATNSLQGAINMASTSTYDVVWVSNGVYDTGGTINYPSGTILTNRIVITKAITVRSKDNNPTNTIIKGAWDPATNGPAAVRCVYMAANSSLIGFTLTNGATLKTAANTYDICGGGVLCPGITTPVISNCVIAGNKSQGNDMGYGGGGAYYGALYNCTLISNSTIYYGGGASRCILSNCMLTGNSGAGAGAYSCTMYSCMVISNTAWDGAGTFGGTVNNCTLANNRASNSGGGASGGTLNNCILFGNKADNRGGGAYGATLYNCTVIGNRGGEGGGTYIGSMINCIVYFNTGSGENYGGAGTFTYSCTTPAPGGSMNITNDPLFINKGSGYGTTHVAGNYHLTPGSPCINAGTNYSWMLDSSDARGKDLDGRARVKYGTVDMGAYEHIRAGTIYGVR